MLAHKQNWGESTTHMPFIQEARRQSCSCPESYRIVNFDEWQPLCLEYTKSTRVGAFAETFSSCKMRLEQLSLCAAALHRDFALRRGLMCDKRQRRHGFQYCVAARLGKWRERLPQLLGTVYFQKRQFSVLRVE